MTVLAAPMRIITIDPGLVTGMAYYEKDHRLRAPTSWELAYEEFPRRLETVLVAYLWHGRADVVCEKYVMMPGVKTPQPEALMLMGVTEYLCRKYSYQLYWQLPKEAKRIAPDALLRQLGWWTKTKDGHANDAIRHVLLRLAHSDPEKLASLIGI